MGAVPTARERVPLKPDQTFAAAAREHKATCYSLIRTYGYRSVCDLGGGRAPLFEPEEIQELDLEYTVLDIDADELALADGYKTHRADICSDADLEGVGPFDLVLSKMLAEHVPDGEAMHRNVRSLLRPGGRAFHFFPTLWNPLFLINRLVPERLARGLFSLVSNRTAPKFPAVYSWCRGPSERQIGRLVGQGWEVDQYRAFYGTDYLERIPILRSIDSAFSDWAAERNSPTFTSYAYLILRRPSGAGRSS